MINRISSALIKITVSIVILFFLFRNIRFPVFWKTVVSVDLFLVAAVILFFICIQAVSAFRWSIILEKDVKIPYPRLFSIYFIGMFFNNFLPTIVGGDVIKGYYLYRSSGRGDVSAASVFMDRYSGFSALILITSLALIPGYAAIRGTGLPAAFALLIGGFLLSSLIIWVGSLHGWAIDILSKVRFYGINKKIDTFYNVLMGYKKQTRIIIKAFLCSLFVQGGVIIAYYMLSRGIGMEVRPGYFFLYIPLTTAISMLPISLSGLGVREGAFVFLFSKVGATQEQALTLSLMWFAITAVVSIIGGIEYLRMGGRKAAAAERL